MTKRMLIASEIRPGSSGAALMHGFRKAGWDVQEVNSRDHFLHGTNFVTKVTARLTHASGVASYNASIMEIADHIRPDVFLTIKGADVASKTLNALAGRGVILANFYPDAHFDFGGTRVEKFAAFDVFVTTKSYQVDYLRQRLPKTRVEFVHHGYSNETQYPRLPKVDEADHLYDVTYVGNHSAYKERWLTRIVERLPHVKLCIVGSRWDTVRDDRLKRCALGNALYGDFYARIMQLSKINLALHSGPSGSDGWEDLVSTRTFEIPACKGFMLHIANTEVQDLFEPGFEIGTFESEDTMLERIEFYLGRPDLRAAMIERAFNRCVPAYGYDARARDISSVLERICPNAGRVSGSLTSPGPTA